MYAQSRKMGYACNLNVVGRKEIKGPKEDSKNMLRSPMSERGKH